MSIEKPLIHLPLDEIKDGKLTNLGTFKEEVKVVGNLQIALDPKVGTCLIFEGNQSHVEIANPNKINRENGFTVSFWVRYEAFLPWSKVFEIKNSKSVDKYVFRILNIDRTNNFSLDFCDENNPDKNFFKEKEWQHLIVTIEKDGTSHLYLNGTLRNSFPRDDSINWDRENSEWTDFHLGTESRPFNGSLGQFRFYDRPLSKADAMALYRKDAHAFAAYRETMPLEVQLETLVDDDYKPILFVEGDKEGAPLDLLLTNPGTKNIDLPKIDKPDANNFHFQLRFRRHVVAPRVLEELRKDTEKVMNGWKYAVCDAAHTGKEDWISFAWHGDTGRSIAPGDAKTIRIDGFSAAAVGGARNTRVMVRYNLKGYEIGAVIRHLEIQNRSGLKTIPIVAEIRGSSTFINGGKKDNEFTILLEYIRESKNLQIPKGAKFVFLWEEEKLVASGSINVASPTEGLESPEKKGDSYVFEVIKDIQLEPGKSIEIDVSGWKTDISTGRHHFLLRYYGIPGFQDGVWPIPVDVGILAQRKIKAPAQGKPLPVPTGEEEGLGIGTDEPMERLHVEGNTLVHGKLLLGEPLKAEKAKDAFETIDPAHKNDAAILFASDYGKDDHAWIRFHSRSNDAYNLEIQVAKKGTDHLVLQPSEGNVGIGTADPSKKLHVNGDTKIDGSLTVGGNHKLQVSHIYGKSGSSEVSDHLYLQYDTEKNVEIGSSGKISGLIVYGDVNVGGTGNARLKTRNIDGKAGNSVASDHLYLQYDTEKNVQVGKSDKKSNLLIYGQVGIGTGTPDAGSALHVVGNTNLHGNVKIGKAEAGKHGNLHVHGYIEMEEAFFKVPIEEIPSIRVGNSDFSEIFQKKLKKIEEKIGEGDEGEVCMFMIKQLPKLLLFAWKSENQFHFAHLKHEPGNALLEVVKASSGQH